MSDYTIKKGATFPPLTIYLVESTILADTKRFPNPNAADAGSTPWVRLVDFATSPPDSITMVARLPSPSTTFSGAMVNAEVVDGADPVGTVEGQFPGLSVPANRGHLRYPWQEGDTDVMGAGYKIEVKVTWDSASTPPAVEKYPNESTRNITLDIDPDLDTVIALAAEPPDEVVEEPETSLPSASILRVPRI